MLLFNLKELIQSASSPQVNLSRFLEKIFQGSLAPGLDPSRISEGRQVCEQQACAGEAQQGNMTDEDNYPERSRNMDVADSAGK